jgi:hypothetical protein
MRVAVEWRSASLTNYKAFCKKFPALKLSYTEWANIIYSYNELFKEYLLETGYKEKLPLGLGDFTIVKKKRRKIITHEGVDHINLPIDWQKTKEKGKVIYNFNYHTEGFFGWHWDKKSARFRHSQLWFFKPSRVTSRLLNHYLKADDKYQHMYCEWKVK